MVFNMEMNRQAEIFQAMERPEFYPHPVSFIEKRETHISKVFLTGNYVYKIKKPFNLGFLDFTTPEKRRHFCSQEVILNRRLTEGVYIDVVRITFKNGRYYLDGPGDTVEYAVKMRQLPDNRSMKYLLQKGKIDKEAVEKLAEILANFYRNAPAGNDINAVGTWETVCTNCEENFEQIEALANNIVDRQKIETIKTATHTFLNGKKELFLHRIANGKICDCHGDLRSEHIYFTDRIQIVDCIEFNDRFRYVDSASDLAFLSMDLDFDGFSDIALHLINTYVQYAGDPEALVLLDFYKCYRACVRGKVNLFRIREGISDNLEKESLVKETNRYIDLAYRYALRFSRHTIWVVCGLPASGKSTVSRELARTFKVKIFNSDVVRKKMFKVQSEKTMAASFEDGIYSKKASSLTYEKLLSLAEEDVGKGNSVILDATFSIKDQRHKALTLAKEMKSEILFVECVSSDQLLKDRLTKRENTVSISDARIDHFEQFKKHFEPIDEVSDSIYICIDTERPLKENMQQILLKNYMLGFLENSC